MDYPGTDGVLIKYIDQGSPAENGGLRLGDIITEIQGNKIASDKDVFEVVYGTDLRVGDDLSLKVWRDGERMDLRMTLKSIRDN